MRVALERWDTAAAPSLRSSTSSSIITMVALTCCSLVNLTGFLPPPDLAGLGTAFFTAPDDYDDCDFKTVSTLNSRLRFPASVRWAIRDSRRPQACVFAKHSLTSSSPRFLLQGHVQIEETLVQIVVRSLFPLPLRLAARLCLLLAALASHFVAFALRDCPRPCVPLGISSSSLWLRSFY